MSLLSIMSLIYLELVSISHKMDSLRYRSYDASNRGFQEKEATDSGYSQKMELQRSQEQSIQDGGYRNVEEVQGRPSQHTQKRSR